MKKSVIKRSIGLLGGAALFFSVIAGVSAGAFEELSASLGDSAKAELKVPVPGRAGVVRAYPQAMDYLTGVAGNQVARIAMEYFMDRATVVGIALDPVLGLPPEPVVSEYHDDNGFTIMASANPGIMPGAGWEVLRSYKVSRYELATAVSHLIADGKLNGKLLEITMQDGGVAIKVKNSPWQ